MLIRLVMGVIAIVVVAVIVMIFKKDDPKGGERYAGRFG